MYIKLCNNTIFTIPTRDHFFVSLLKSLMFGHSLSSTFTLFHGLISLRPWNSLKHSPLLQKHFSLYLQAVGCILLSTLFQRFEIPPDQQTSVDSNLRMMDSCDPCNPANSFYSIGFRLD